MSLKKRRYFSVFTFQTKFYKKLFLQMLQTKKLGQLVIYSDILTSSMDVMESHMVHGLAVIPRQQTQGQGISFFIYMQTEKL